MRLKKKRKVLLLNSRTTGFMNSGNGMSFRRIFHYAQVVCLLDTNDFLGRKEGAIKSKKLPLKSCNTRTEQKTETKTLILSLSFFSYTEYRRVFGVYNIIQNFYLLYSFILKHIRAK